MVPSLGWYSRLQSLACYLAWSGTPVFSFAHGTLPEAVLPLLSRVWYLVWGCITELNFVHGTLSVKILPPSVSRLQSPAFSLAHSTLPGGGPPLFSLTHDIFPGALLPPSVSCVVPLLGWYSCHQSYAWYLCWGGTPAFSFTHGTLPGAVPAPLVSRLQPPHGTLPRAVLPPSVLCVVPCLGRYSRLQSRVLYLARS